MMNEKVMYNTEARLPFLTGILFLLLAGGCDIDYKPKPRAYPRIAFPQRAYKQYAPDSCPFQFKLPIYAKVEPYTFGKSEPCWQTIHFEPFNAQLHLSYKQVNGDTDRLYQMAEDARAFVYRHTVKAQTVDEALITNPQRNVSGILYQLGGEAASAVQFYVTDSSRHYLRGALYFKTRTNRDSLAPIIDFLEKDIEAIIRSIRWQETAGGMRSSNASS